MRLLLDSDVFCKLGIGNLLDDALIVLGAGIGDCGRLPALPYMLRKGRLPNAYGVNACVGLVAVAKKMKPIPAPTATWLDRLTSVQRIDPGEAQLFALAAQDSLIVITGDKRALLALKDVEGYPDALAGRIVVMEAVLLAVCDQLGPAEVRRRLGSLTISDATLKVCFSSSNQDPRIGLESYYRSLVDEVRPLRLWERP